MKKLKVLDLFSGIGGFSLGLERTGGFETVAFCEIEPFPRKVLAKHWPEVPCYDDVRTLTAERLAADGIALDVICGGYPCQPFSTAGRRQGDQDDRHLWPEVRRLVDELRPAWFVGENVTGHISMGLDEVLSDLAALGYAARVFVIPACAVDASHRRDRVWIVANASGGRLRGAEGREIQFARGAEVIGASEVVADTPRRLPKHNDGRSAGKALKDESRAISIGGSEHSTNVPDAASQRQSGSGQSIERGSQAQDGKGQANQSLAIGEPRFWPVEPDVGRVANGVPARMDRLKSLGNAVVPQIPELIGNAILESMKEAA